MKKILVFIMVLMMVVPFQAFAYLEPAELPKETGKDFNGMFEIDVKIGESWTNAGNLQYGKFQETKEINLGEFISSENALIRIRQKGGGASYLDAVFLDGAPPLKANGNDNKVLYKLTKEDLDITPVENEIILEFEAADGKGILSLTGRIENEVISNEPLQFPIANNYKQKNQIADFYSYTLNSSYEKLTVDGVLDEVVNKETFAKEYQVPGSGHPAGDTYFWVMNDDENLYVTMDFTPDNTYDGDKDYAKVYVKTDEGIREFMVSVPETAWGRAGFTYTDKVTYEHKVYEFAIPLSEICNPADELELAFVGYGTASLPAVCLPRLAYDPDNEIYLSVYQKAEIVNGFYLTRVYGQFVYRNSYGTETVYPEFLISDYEDESIRAAFPDVAYDIDNKAFLVVWTVGDSIDYAVIGVEYVDKDNDIINHDIVTIDTLYHVSIEDGYLDMPALAYDSHNGVFLIVWEEYADYYTTIKGMLFDLAQANAEVPILTISMHDYADDIAPSVCYSYAQDLFLVIWKSYDEALMIQGNVITGTGENPPPQDYDDLILINQSSFAYGIFGQNVSINESTNEFLVTWGNYDHVIYGTNVTLSDPYTVSEPEVITPEVHYACHPSAFYDGKGSMVVFWNDCIVDTRYGYIKMITLGQSEVRGTYNPEYTDTYSGNQEYNLLDSCGDGNGEILVAYGGYPVGDMSGFIGYRFVSDRVPEFIDESYPDLAYHPDLDLYLSVFTHEDYNSEEYSSYIYGQLIDNEANPIGDKFLINDGTDNENPADDGCLQEPTVAVDKNGDFLVAWTQGYSYSKIYASKVTLNELSTDTYEIQVGDAFRVSENTDYDDDGEWQYFCEYTPDIAYSSEEDNFLIVWTQYINGSFDDLSKYDLDIYGSMVSIEGNIAHSTFPVSTKIIDDDLLDQGEASVCYSESDRKFIAAWTEMNNYEPSIIAVVIGDDGKVYFDDRLVIAENAINANVAFNKDKFFISWANDNTYEIWGAYFTISDDSPEIIDEEFMISPVETLGYMDYIYPAAYFDGHDKMLCVWNPGYSFELFTMIGPVNDNLYANLAYVDYDGITGEAFYTDEPENVCEDSPIAISGNMMGQFLIAYKTPIASMHLKDPLYRIGYRLIGEFIPEPEEPGLEFVDTPYEVRVGNTLQAQVEYFDGTAYIDVTDEILEYRSENPEIATITSGGAITGLAVGKTRISADYLAWINDLPTTFSAITTVSVTKKSEPRPSPEKEIIGQIIVDGKIIKNIYPEDLVSDGGIYSFEAAKTGNNAKLWLLSSYYKQIANKTPKGTLQLVWDAASYNLPLKSQEVLKEVNGMGDSRVNIVIEKIDDKDIMASALTAIDKLGGKLVSGLVDFDISVEGKTKTVSIDSYDLYVDRTIDKLNTLDYDTTSAMKLIEDDEVFTFTPSVFSNGSAAIKYRGNGIFAIVTNPKTFSDISNHWSRMNVEKLAARNIAYGKDEQIFAPNDYITRAEFAVMITRALGITEEEGTINFEDVEGWYAEDISTAYDVGLISGRGDGKFYPNERILRKDMAVMIHNALKFADKEIGTKNIEGILSRFTDSAAIAEYAKESTAVCADAGIIMGRDTKEFDPDENATRAEASAIIERMLEYLEFIN